MRPQRVEWDGDKLATGFLEGKGQPRWESALREDGHHFHKPSCSAHSLRHWLLLHWFRKCGMSQKQLGIGWHLQGFHEFRELGPVPVRTEASATNSLDDTSRTKWTCDSSKEEITSPEERGSRSPHIPPWTSLYQHIHLISCHLWVIKELWQRPSSHHHESLSLFFHFY